MKADESVLDFPKEGLCPDIWEKVIDEMGAEETWRPIVDVEDKILNIVQMLCEKAQLIYDNMRVFITGSITSNTYNKTADVDVHIRLTKRIREFDSMTQDRVNSAMKALDAEWKAAGQNPDDVKSWHGHPLQFYYQTDEFQDFMSVGCYDVKNKKWLVGPELKDPSYNPYSELYKDIQAKAGKLINDIRGKVLDVYEKAVVLKKVLTHSSDAQTSEYTFTQFFESLHSAVTLYENARQMRKVYSSPESIEQALQFRSSKKWKIADAAFKLMDKFGYLAILKKYKELDELISNGDNELAIETAEAVLATVKDYISNPEKLADSEKEQVDEGNKDMLTTAALVALIAIKNICPAASLEPELKSIPKTEFRASSNAFKQALAKATKGKIYNGMNLTNIVNCTARTIYAEAKSETSDGRKAIASVLWNRAGGKCENLVKVISKRDQWSCWRKYKGGWDDKTYTYNIPPDTFGNSGNQQIWRECVSLATQLANEEFTSTIGNRNIYTSEKDNQKAKDSWGKLCDKKIGFHTFGYDRSQDGFRKGNKTVSPSTYVVKAGDTLEKIAKAYNTTVDELQKKNKIKDRNKISIGQKILV